MMHQILHLLLCNLLLKLLILGWNTNYTVVSAAGYLTTPNILWSFEIPGGGSLYGGRNVRQENAVVVTPDGSRVLVTADDGTLHFIVTEAISSSTFYEPESVPETYRECRSGVALVSQNGNSDVVDLAVYAVIDTPEEVGVFYVDSSGEFVNSTAATDSSLINSRVIAVNMSAALVWTAYVPGRVAGTPVVSTDQQKIFVVHNVDDSFGISQGYISIFTRSGQILATLVNHRLGPFTPPAIQSISGSMSHDMVVVAESWGEGYSDRGVGQIQLLVPSDQYDELNGQGTLAYQWLLLSDWGLPSVAKPLVKDSFLWMAGQGAELAGWATSSLLAASTANLSASGTNPTWQTPLLPSERNVTQPLGSSPIVSSDGSRIYMNGASIDFLCIDAVTGKVIWSDLSGFSTFTAEPKLTEIPGQNSVVYAIETLTGNIKQFDAQTGKINWAIGCDQLTDVQNCANAVEAEFSVSSDGDEIYFGDVYGNIYAVQVADFATPAPTAIPTVAPTLGAPSTAPISISPSTAPISISPSKAPIRASPPPTRSPVASPTIAATSNPSVVTPTVPATSNPTLKAPTVAASSNPTVMAPTVAATSNPTVMAPTVATTSNPSVAATQSWPVALAAPTAAPDNVTAGIGVNHAEAAPSQASSQSSLSLILGSVVGILAFLVIVAAFVVRHYRNKRMAELAAEKDEKEERWRREKAEYDEECRRNEEEEIQEIVAASSLVPSASAILSSPSKEKKRRRRGKKAKSFNSPKTPTTLSSIEETPDEIDSIGSDRRGRPHRGSRSRSLDRLLAKLMRVKTEKPPVRNLETAFENVAEEEVMADSTAEEAHDEVEEVEEKKRRVQDDAYEHSPSLDTDDDSAGLTIETGVRSKSVGPARSSAHIERQDLKPPRAPRSQSLERILGRLTGNKPIRPDGKLFDAPAERLLFDAPAVSEGPPTPVRSNKMASMKSEDTLESTIMEAGGAKADRELEGRFSPVQVNENYPDQVAAIERRAKSPNAMIYPLSLLQPPIETGSGNLKNPPNACDSLLRAKSPPMLDEVDRIMPEPISPIPSVGSSSHGRSKQMFTDSRESSMSPTNSNLSSSSFSLDGYSLPGEDHSVSTGSGIGSGITEEQRMIRRRNSEHKRNFEVVRPSPSTSEDDRLAQVNRFPPALQFSIAGKGDLRYQRSISPTGLEPPSSIPFVQPFSSRPTAATSSGAIFPQLPGQRNITTPEDMISLDSSLYLEDSRSQGALSPTNVLDEPPSMQVHSFSPRSPASKPDAIFPQLPGHYKSPALGDVASVDSSLYLDDNSVCVSAITFDRDKDEASVVSGIAPSTEQELSRPRTIKPLGPPDPDFIEEDTIPPGAHYVRPPQAPGQASQEKANSIMVPQKSGSVSKVPYLDSKLSDIDVSASINRYNRSLQRDALANPHRSRDPSDEQQSISSMRRQHALLDMERPERRSHSVVERRRRPLAYESADEKSFGDDTDNVINTRRSRNLLPDRHLLDRPDRGVSSGAETRYSSSRASDSADGSDRAVSESTSRHATTQPRKEGVAGDSWSKFLRDLAKAERAFFYPSMDVKSPTRKEESGDDESEEEAVPPPPPSSPPPPSPPMLPRPVGQDTRRRLV